MKFCSMWLVGTTVMLQLRVLPSFLMSKSLARVDVKIRPFLLGGTLGVGTGVGAGCWIGFDTPGLELCTGAWLLMEVLLLTKAKNIQQSQKAK